MKSGMDNGGEGLPGQPTILQEEGDVPGGLDSNVLVPVNQVGISLAQYNANIIQQ